MKVLNVAEKNDAAKNIAAHLSRGASRMRPGYSKYNKIYEFDYQLFGTNCKMIMTSVSGHLLTMDFASVARSWNSCNPLYLFEAPIIRYCTKEYEDIKRTLEKEIRSCSKLIIWTDCDREGENIGFEVIEVCTAVKPNVDIYRAKFSEITQPSVERALRVLERPNERINVAVNVRRELDLRIGAAFTRFQTLHLKGAFPDALGTSLVSYGSCQFPTLGFVVERFKEIANFIPETFWKVTVHHTKHEITVEFTWERNRLFHKLACEVLYDICKENGVAKVVSVESKPKTKWRPKPLDTVELEKLASKKLHIKAKDTMKIAEKLYTSGFISYPRTETTIFPKEMNLSGIVENFVHDPAWGDFASRVLQDGPNPFQGNKSDQAHPPIHPIKYTSDLLGDEQRLYDFIVRHFLACLSKHAEGLETVVKIDIANEKFTGKGLMITARNYLEIYPFDKWSDKEIHVYQVGDLFTPDIGITEGETCPPPHLTEADLIALMEKHGIGTDATHADHIETIKSRFYVGLNDHYFVPRTLGMGLVEGYDSMGFEMSKPNLRAELERDLTRICDGTKQGEEVLSTQLGKYREIFQKAQNQVQKLNAAIEKYMNVEAQEVPVSGAASSANEFQIQKVMDCPKCGFPMTLRDRKNGEGKFVSCSGYPQCREVIFFDSFVREVTVTTDRCPKCPSEVYQIKFKFDRSGSCFLPSVYVSCLGGCDPCLDAFLKAKQFGSVQRPFMPAPSEPPTQRRLVTPNNSVVTSDSGFCSDENNTLPGDSVTCDCGRPAAKLTVKKAGPNCGKLFYSCGAGWGEQQRCDFFQWVDGNNGRTGQRQGRSSSTMVKENTAVCCFCGTPAKRCEVHKDGPNKGKKFFACSKPMSDTGKCSFFQWYDGDTSEPTNEERNAFASHSSSTSTRGRGRTSGRGRNGSGGGKKQKCGSCGLEGHNRRYCPID